MYELLVVLQGSYDFLEIIKGSYKKKASKLYKFRFRLKLTEISWTSDKVIYDPKNLDWFHKFSHNVVRGHIKILYRICNPHWIPCVR